MSILCLCGVGIGNENGDSNCSGTEVKRKVWIDWNFYLLTHFACRIMGFFQAKRTNKTSVSRSGHYFEKQIRFLFFISQKTDERHFFFIEN